MRVHNTLPLAAVAFMLAASVAAMAQEDTVTQEATASPAPLRERFRAACGADVETYCAVAETRNERVACVTMHHDDFSESCQAFFAEHAPNLKRDD